MTLPVTCSRPPGVPVRVLVLDNYDSFTWNLVQMMAAQGAECTVRRSDAVTLDEVASLHPDRIVLSPGPFGPERTGVCREVVDGLSADVPTLGVCLGMQVIAVAAGARVSLAGAPVHGKQCTVRHQGTGVLRGLPSPLQVGLYHSLIVDPASVDDGLEITATSDGGDIIMGCRMVERQAEGVLFHPESFLTEGGDRVLSNFLEGTGVVG